jgi:hypothetical protein
MVLRFSTLFLAITLSAKICIAGEDLITTAKESNGEIVPYVLNYDNLSPNYVLILFPGGNGIVDPHMVGSKLVYKAKNNFLLRARTYFVDGEFVTVSTNSTQAEERIQALIDDLKQRFPQAKIYLIGTSKGTFDTMRLADFLSDKITGVIHTSSVQGISLFNAKKYGNRQLVVHHRDDSCQFTPFVAAESSHEHYGNDFISMEGGISVGDPCEAFAHHGYNGIEKETVYAIKNWIKQGG